MYQFEVNKGTKEVFGNFFFNAFKSVNSNTKQKLYNVEPIQAVLWVIKGPKCLYGRWHIYGQKIDGFQTNLTNLLQNGQILNPSFSFLWF